jgi:hypothetical protein
MAAATDPSAHGLFELKVWSTRERYFPPIRLPLYVNCKSSRFGRFPDVLNVNVEESCFEFTAIASILVILNLTYESRHVESVVRPFVSA